MKRLFEDPQAPEALRDDLRRSREAGQDYPTADKLAQLKAALADPTRDPLAQDGHGAGLSWGALHPAWKLAALLVLAGTGAFVLRPSAREPSSGALVSPPTAAERTPELHADDVEPLGAVAPGEDVVGDNSSRREIAQLVKIRALLEQDPLAAYRLAQRSEREFPRGVLVEERQALAIVALRRAGKHALARERAREFFSRFPQSPMRAIIEAELDRARP